MKIKLKHLKVALRHIEYNTNREEEPSVEVSLREENFDNGQIGSVLTLTVAYEKAANSWETVKSKKQVTHCIEIFEDSDSNPPRVSTKETQQLADD